MCKEKGLLKKLLAIVAVAGGAAVLFMKLKKGGCKNDTEDIFDDEELSFNEETDTSARNYVPISHGEGTASEESADSEEAAPEEAVAEEVVAEEAVSEEAAAENGVSEEAVSGEPVAEAAAPATEDFAAKLEQAVAETEARYEEAAKSAEISEDEV